MKIFTVILSIYVLALSFVTCNDAVSHETTLNETVSNVSEPDHHSDEGTADYCSPFCSCQCCQVNLNVQHNDVFDITVSKISTKVHVPTYSVKQEFTYSIFQPPQV